MDIFYAKAAAYLGAAIVMGIGSIGPSIGQGMVGTKACESVAKYPESEDKIRSILFVSMTFIEACAIYAFLIAIMLLVWNK